MTMMIVKWDLSDLGRPKGSAVECDGMMWSSKIVFPDRAARSRTLDGELWECGVVCDTKPQDPRKGAVIVRPVRPLTWAWVDVGPELWGARERQLRCAEYPSLDASHGPRDQTYYNRQRQENAAWQEARSRQDLWRRSWLSEEFFLTFGRPSAVRVSGGERVALVYPHGEKEVDARQLSLYWKSNSTGRTRLADSVVEAEFRLVDSDVCFWDRVGMLSEHGMPPHALTRFDSLAPDHRVAVIEALRAEAPDPEDLARDNWEQRPSRMATLWEELPLLFLPAKIVTSRYMGTVYYPESDDGFRPAGSLDAVLTRLVLETGGGLGRFVLLDGLQHEATLDAEAERGRLIREQMLKIDDLLVALAPQYPAHGEEFLSVGPAEWEARYRKAWDALADAYRLDAAREAAARLRSMLDDLEWGAWCSRAPDIQVDQDATSLPPVARRDVGRQIAYGVAHAQQEWSGARWLTVWYRDEADAIAAHAQAAEDLASLVAARASLEVSAAEAARDLTRSHVIASPDAAISDPEIPATMTSVSDLKARFNRRR